MILMNEESLCANCKQKPKITQPDGTERTEKWICIAYPKQLPYEIMAGGKCEFYKPIS